MRLTHPRHATPRTIAVLGALVLGAAAAVAGPGATAATVAPVNTLITVDGTSAGRTFDGVGAISGGGGNSRLLIDYPEPERSQILDYLFKPGYGASVQVLKIEIGGDANSTDGAEPSVEHVKGQVDCSAGYEFWLARQALARNHRLKLYGLAWAAPGWIGGGTNYWVPDSIDYLLTWLSCAQRQGLTISYLGGRNEKGHDKTWYENLRTALDQHGYQNVQIVGDDSVHWTVADDMVADPAFAAAVGVVGVHYPCGYLKPALTCPSTAHALATGKPLWASENGSLDVDGGAAAMIRSITRGYLDGKITAYLNWPLVAAITPNLPFATDGLAVAPSPWSGAYRLGKQTWTMAQVTQFAQPGWQFLGSGSGYLGGDRTNGSYVSLKSPDRRDFSTIIETTTATQPQTVDLSFAGGLRADRLHVWATDLSSAAAPTNFARLPDLTASSGHYTMTLQPGYVYSLTTMETHDKGVATSPAAHPMPLPYADDFNHYQVGAEAKYLSDMQGAFEIRPCLGGREGRCVQQVAPVKPIEWQGDSDAYALLGDPGWTNYTVSVDVNLQQPGTVELLGRANTQARPQSKQAGYQVRVSDTGAWSLLKNDTHATLTQLAAGTATPLALNSWHRLTLRLQGTSVTAALDATTLATVTDASYPAGQVGFGVVGYQTDQFDNLSITPEP
jgi:O-glycosyl hydrolase